MLRAALLASLLLLFPAASFRAQGSKQLLLIMHSSDLASFSQTLKSEIAQLRKSLNA